MWMICVIKIGCIFNVYTDVRMWMICVIKFWNQYSFRTPYDLCHQILESVFFQNTLFLVDRFHWRGHIGCSKGYCLDSYKKIDTSHQLTSK